MTREGKYAAAGVSDARKGGFVGALLQGVGQDELAGIFAKYTYIEGLALGISTDGVGSKLLAYQEDPQTLSRAGYDLGAMLFHDLGAEFIRPFLMTNYVANHRSDPEIGKLLGQGLGRALREVWGAYLAGGETAELPDQIKEGTFDWAGAVVGVEPARRHHEWISKREGISAGLTLIGIEGIDSETGLHTLQSNGFTLARRLPAEYRHHLRIPSVIVSDLMMDLRDDGAASFFVPITGGGYKNIERVLRGKQLDADVSLAGIPDVFRVIQGILAVPEKEMYEVFNMGNIVVVGTDSPGKVMDSIRERGRKGKEIGQLSAGTGQVRVNGIAVGTYST